MWTKIYLVSLALCIVVVGIPSYNAASWLGSIGSPVAAIEGFEHSAKWAWPLLWVTSAGLLILASALLWTTKKAWALWATFSYFAVFLFINSLWLTPSARRFADDKGIAVNAALIGPFLAAVLILLAFAIVFLDQFIILRTREKTIGEPPSPLETGSANEGPEKE